MRQIETYSLLTLISAALLLGGCNKEKPLPEPEEERVKVAVTTEIGTKASGTSWDTGDRIGLTMLATNTWTTSEAVDNFEYLVNTPESGGASGFEPVNEENTAYFPANGDNVDFFAYYPYNEAVENFIYPVSVANQSSLPAIDLMSAHSKGYNKQNPSVLLTFSHKLTDLRFILTSDHVTANDIAGAVLKIKGMHTTASYNMSTSTLTNRANIADITVPINSDGTAEAIVLPRSAGSGVTFEIVLQDNTTYTATMSSSQTLRAGTKNTFRISLQANPLTVSASVEDWGDGGSVSLSGSVTISNPPGTSSGFSNGNTIMLYKSSTLGNYGVYTYSSSSGSWTSSSPLAWNTIGNNVNLYAWSPNLQSSKLPSSNNLSIVASDYSTTPILLSNNVKNLSTGNPAALAFTHILSQVTVTLSAGTGVSSTEISGATITLPALNKSGSLNITNGAFSSLSSSGDFTKTSSGGSYNLYIIPQTKSANATLVSITIGSNTYNVSQSSAFAFTAGKHHKLNITVSKQTSSTNVEMSATVTDWTVDNYNFSVQ